MGDPGRFVFQNGLVMMLHIKTQKEQMLWANHIKPARCCDQAGGVESLTAILVAAEMYKDEKILSMIFRKAAPTSRT